MEEHLLFYVNGDYLGRTVQTPGNDIDLAYGYALVEGAITSAEDVTDAHLERLAPHMQRVDMTLTPERSEAWAQVRGCEPWHGTRVPGMGNTLAFKRADWSIPPEGVEAAMACMEGAQVIFPRTGGAHCAALFSRTGCKLAQAEDIGRHNALDKVIGRVLRSGEAEEAAIGIMSSRLSWELVRKAAAAGIEMLAGISAATSFAVETAEQCGITLVGRVRGGTMTVYCHGDRIARAARGGHAQQHPREGADAPLRALDAANS